MIKVNKDVRDLNEKAKQKLIYTLSHAGILSDLMRNEDYIPERSEVQKIAVSIIFAAGEWYGISKALGIVEGHETLMHYKKESKDESNSNAR